jgi:hypothetical protein
MLAEVLDPGSLHAGVVLRGFDEVHVLRLVAQQAREPARR